MMIIAMMMMMMPKILPRVLSVKLFGKCMLITVLWNNFLRMMFYVMENCVYTDHQ